MDAYLEIAEKILREEKRPLSSRAILAAAYKRALVPQHLYGKTQHKTLQARISEDIIRRHERSPFFRTAPGKFFLREFLTDTSLPEEFRRSIPTKRRIRELTRGLVLSTTYAMLRRLVVPNAMVSAVSFLNAISNNFFRYIDARKPETDEVLLRSFVCVRRGQQILTYRLGRYRDDRDTFMSKRSIGFSTLIELEDLSLFSPDGFGIIDAGIRATKLDLDIPEVSEAEIEAILTHFIWVEDGKYANDLLAVINFKCPDWFEPTRRRLALNDLTWLDTTTAINDIDDFDPWSKMILQSLFETGRAVDVPLRQSFYR